MKPQWYDRELPAVHELGHLAAHAFYGHKVVSIEVGENSGHCRLAAPQRVSGLQLLVTFHAGKAAMDHWYGWKSSLDENWRQSKDYKMGYKIALELSSGNHEAASHLMQWAEKMAD